MTYSNHNVKDVTADGAVKAGHGVIVSVHVVKAGASGDKVVFHNGDTNSDPAEFTVYDLESILPSLTSTAVAVYVPVVDLGTLVVVLVTNV